MRRALQEARARQALGPPCRPVGRHGGRASGARQRLLPRPGFPPPGGRVSASDADCEEGAETR
eukprot:5663551-Lingulodinium_polyedra.AAC.1